ncbi:MAG: hypothetical protein JST19_13080 [Bacteroidetes bacterium]|nr:hypothetical protein [Bacteroidota bacterium]
MKVTPANNRRMVMISIANISLLFLLTLARINAVGLDTVADYGLHMIDEISYLTMLWYLVSIIQFTGESISVQTPFSIFLGLQLVNYICSFTALFGMLIEGLGILMGVITIYVAVYAFHVKHKMIKSGFRILGVALFGSILLKFSLAFLPITSGRHHPSPGVFIGFIDLIPVLAILYIILQVNNLLKTTSQISTNP